MKKNYLTPSIMVVEYNHVDIVTASVVQFQDFAHIKDSWIDADWLSK